VSRKDDGRDVHARYSGVFVGLGVVLVGEAVLFPGIGAGGGRAVAVAKDPPVVSSGDTDEGEECDGEEEGDEDDDAGVEHEAQFAFFAFDVEGRRRGGVGIGGGSLGLGGWSRLCRCV